MRGRSGDPALRGSPCPPVIPGLRAQPCRAPEETAHPRRAGVSRACGLSADMTARGRPKPPLPLPALLLLLLLGAGLRAAATGKAAGSPAGRWAGPARPDRGRGCAPWRAGAGPAAGRLRRGRGDAAPRAEPPSRLPAQRPRRAPAPPPSLAGLAPQPAGGAEGRGARPAPTWAPLLRGGWHTGRRPGRCPGLRNPGPEPRGKWPGDAGPPSCGSPGGCWGPAPRALARPAARLPLQLPGEG